MRTKNKQKNPVSPSNTNLLCNDCWEIYSWKDGLSDQFGYEEQHVIGTSFLHYVLIGFNKQPPPSSLGELFADKTRKNGKSITLYGVATHQNQTNFPVELFIIENPEQQTDQKTYTVNIINLLNSRQEEPEQQIDQLQVINHIFELSLEPCPLKDTLEKILDHLISIKNLGLLPNCAIYTIEKPSNTLSQLAGRGIYSGNQSISDLSSISDLCKDAAKTGEIKRSRHVQKPPEPAESSVSCETFAIPIKKGAPTIGVFSCSVEIKRTNLSSLIHFLEGVAHVMGIIIENQLADLQLLNMVHDLRNSIVNLREEKKYSESIIQGLSHGLLVTDTDGTIQKSNAVAQSILKPFDTSINYKKLQAVIGEEEATTILTPQTTATLPPAPQELTLTTDSGISLILSYSTVSREDSTGKSIGAIVSFTEISEITFARREMEKVNRLSTMAEIASAVAHEVRNPLGGIKIMAQAIEEESSSTDEQNECAVRIIRQVDRLNELLTDFFSYARPAPPKKRVISFVTVFSEIKHLVHNKLVENNIELIETYPNDLPPIFADPNQMQQVLLNLMLNAIDATQRHGRITIIAQSISQEMLDILKKQLPGVLTKSKYLHVIVADNGEGMSKETQEKLFEPFFTTKRNGTGLGMSIVYRTIKENDAAITVTSKEGEGTSFTILLPIP